MPNPLKQKLIERAQALQAQRTERAAQYAGDLAAMDAKLVALRDLAQNWDTYTVEQALAKLAQTGVDLEVR